MTEQRQNADGGWEPARPLGWQGGLDWEVATLPTGKRLPTYRAELYDEDVLIAVIESRVPRLLKWRMKCAKRRGDGAA